MTSSSVLSFSTIIGWWHKFITLAPISPLSFRLVCSTVYLTPLWCLRGISNVACEKENSRFFASLLACPQLLSFWLMFLHFSSCSSLGITPPPHLITLKALLALVHLKSLSQLSSFFLSALLPPLFKLPSFLFWIFGISHLVSLLSLLPWCHPFSTEKPEGSFQNVNRIISFPCLKSFRIVGMSYADNTEL